MEERTERDPIWIILAHRHQNYRWLSDRTGYSLQYIRELASDKVPASAQFRAKAAWAMDMPEEVLFRKIVTPA